MAQTGELTVADARQAALTIFGDLAQNAQHYNARFKSKQRAIAYRLEGYADARETGENK